MRTTTMAAASAALVLGMFSSPASAADVPAVPHLVRDATPGAAGSWVGDGVALGSRLVYGYYGAKGPEVWVSDGTKAGTSILRDILPGPGGSEPDDFVVLGRQVYFSAGSSTTNRELWVTDGTSSGTRRVADLRPGPAGSFPDELTVAGGYVYFVADDGVHGDELWRTRGTASTTRLVKDVNPGGYGSNIGWVTAWGDQVVMSAYGPGGLEPWVSDGTSSGTHAMGDIAPGAAGSSPAHFAPFDTAAGRQVLFMASTPADGFELWRSDGVNSTQVKNISLGGGTDSSSPHGFVRYGNRMVFSAQTTATGRELWATDGTTAGTQPITDIMPGSGPGVVSEHLTLYRNRIYFTGQSTDHDRELWVTDSSAAGTHQVVDTWPGGSGDTDDLRVVGGRLFFTSESATTGTELWQTDGVHTSLVKDVRPGADGSRAETVAGVSSTIFFAADDGKHGEELWAHTLTPSVTRATPRSSYRSSTDRKKQIRVAVRVTASSTTPIGTVRLTRGSRTVGRATLHGGKASIRIRTTLGRGTHHLKASYAGSVKARSSRSSTFTITVR